MSELEHREQQLELCNGGIDDDDEDKDEHDDGGDGAFEGSKVEVEVNRKGVFGLDFRKAIKRSFRRKKRKRMKEKDMARADDEAMAAARRRGRRIGSGGGCYVCFLEPRTEESPETPTSDPNSESFSLEMLRNLMEKNDFYSKECNAHI